ncbi:MAG: exosortase-associated EpsI family protein [Planctomycetota bacterium]|nr:exosortase-associated EpsI family protein [Planctomycetota bacterium]
MYVKPMIATLLLLAVALVESFGLRHADSDESLDHAAMLLKDLPRSVDGWSCEELEKSQEELGLAEAHGHIYRRYTKPGTEDEVIVFMLFGRPGPISLHPPTACYRSRGYRVRSANTCAIEAAGQQHHFQLAEFWNPSSVTDDRAGVLWSWTATDKWLAPENPRMHYSGVPVLYKVYFAWNRSGSRDALRDSVPVTFLRDFIASVARHRSR